MTIHSMPNLKTNCDNNSYFYGVFEPEHGDKGRKIFEFFCGFLRMCGGEFTCSFNEANADHNIQWKVKTLDEETKKVANLWVAFNSPHTLKGHQCHTSPSHEKLERTFITEKSMSEVALELKYELDSSTINVIEPNNLMDLIELRSKELKDKIKSFNDFYMFYLQEHTKQGTRNWHLAGTTAAVSLFTAGLFTSGWFILAAPFAGYIPAWYSHFKIEENRPATWLGIREIFKSLSCDFVMGANRIRGTLNEDLRLSGVNPDKK